MDYLAARQFLPKQKSPSKEERDCAVQTHKCKTCVHYNFYFCRRLQTTCGPEGNCLNLSNYLVKPEYIEG